jgi:hypothetical protein
MPYIENNVRAAIDAGRMKPRNCGELNYALTMAIINSAKVHGITADKATPSLPDTLRAILVAYLEAEPLRYQRVNDMIGAAECAVLEFDRRAAHSYRYQKTVLLMVARSLYRDYGAPYEDLKISENGDIPY